MYVRRVFDSGLAFIARRRFDLPASEVEGGGRPRPLNPRSATLGLFGLDGVGARRCVQCAASMLSMRKILRRSDLLKAENSPAAVWEDAERCTAVPMLIRSRGQRLYLVTCVLQILMLDVARTCSDLCSPCVPDVQ